MLLTADFETTTDEKDCRVWAWGVCEIGNPDYFVYGNSLDTFFDYLETVPGSTVYFHNIKFDGEFLFVYLFEHGFSLAEHVYNEALGKYVDVEKSKTFTTLISNMGQFYAVKIIFEKKGKKTKYIQMYDSMKILPFSVAEVAKGFNLPISKLELDYNAYREPGHILTEEEISYLRNDVDIMARALKVLFDQNLQKMTQGSNALYDFKQIYGPKRFKDTFPVPDYDQYVRGAYKGGYTYLRPEFAERDLSMGLVFDVNSLYPSVMYDCPLPYGEGVYFEGEYKPHDLYPLYVQTFICQFELKPGYVPTLQIKENLRFIPTEYLTTSGDQEVTLCLSSVDIDLFFKHYDVDVIEYVDGWMFKATDTIFKPYIDKWMKVKIESTLNGNKAMRTLSKLMLNALYGKFALNPNVQGKFPEYNDGKIIYHDGPKERREPIYIPVGVFITAWARHKTISNAQKLYKYFRYADTDSLHLEIPIPKAMQGMSEKELEALTTADLREMGLDLPEDFEVDPVKLGAWKLESHFTRARFIRQKSYIEDSNPPETWEDPETYDRGRMKITCAGMPKSCYEFVTWENFRVGSTFGGKLTPKHVKGGIVLRETDFTIRKY